MLYEVRNTLTEYCTYNLLPSGELFSCLLDTVLK